MTNALSIKSPLIQRKRIDADFLGKVLTPYRAHCQYLKQAEWVEDAEGLTGMEGQFAIEDSCYIDDTGHFNAVEFNICYNQIAYLYLGYGIQHQLLPELQAFSTEQFHQKQLSHFLIVDIHSSYAAELNAKAFYGRFRMGSMRQRKKHTFIKTECEFWDDQKGRAKGQVTLAVRHPNNES